MGISGSLVIVGARGYIGAQLLAETRHCGIPVVGTSSTGGDGMLPLDLIHPEAFDYDAVPTNSTVIVTAAVSSPDRCTNSHGESYAVNVTGTIRFIEHVLARGARVIFLSSDAVYGETSNPVDEEAPCHPIGAYAEMKLEVEQRFRNDPKFRIARLSYVFSRDDKFTRYILGCAQNHEVAEIFHPFTRSVIYRGDVVRGILAMCEQWSTSQARVVNFGGPTPVSRRHIAQAFLKLVTPDLVVQEVSPGSDFFKDRARDIQLVSRHLPFLLGRPQLSIEQAIKMDFSTEIVNGF